MPANLSFHELVVIECAKIYFTQSNIEDLNAFDVGNFASKTSYHFLIYICRFICKTEINKSCMSVCNCQKFQTEKWKVCLIATFVSVLKCPRMDRLLIFGVGICSIWFWQTNVISYHSSNPFIYFAICTTLKKIEKVNRYEFEIKEASSKSVS